MAKHDVNYSCGHSATVQLLGKVKDRERKIKYFEASGLCPECYKMQKREEETAKEVALWQYIICL